MESIFQAKPSERCFLWYVTTIMTETVFGGSCFISRGNLTFSAVHQGLNAASFLKVMSASGVVEWSFTCRSCLAALKGFRPKRRSALTTCDFSSEAVKVNRK